MFMFENMKVKCTIYTLSEIIFQIDSYILHFDTRNYQEKTLAFSFFFNLAFTK